MTQDARQPAEATDYAEKARELAESVWIIGNRVHTYETKKGEIAIAILAALQSAHAAGEAKGDAAGFERGVQAAETRARRWERPVDQRVNHVSVIGDAILALLPSQPKEQI